MVRLAVHRCRALVRAPDHVASALAGGAMVALWGSAQEVRQAAEGLEDVGIAVVSADMHYFVRQRLGGSRLQCSALVIRVLSAVSAPLRPV